ncbi:MAG TPA: hypothetical protein VLD19_12295 [Chitinophagaceae bacterium]|nr:hypothetical protein [Chitinophagaceae bacterium]
MNTICITCGTQFTPGLPLPALCPVCEDDRQYIGAGGQQWTSLPALSDKYSVLFKKINEHLYELTMTPAFAIGQRAFLILSPHGNILWDCIPLINEPVAEFIKSKGGLKAIVFSHPHYYSTMNVWAEQFDCPVYIHRDDEHWIKNWGPHVQLWAGPERDFWDGIKAVHVGGHFPGSAVLQVPSLSPGGALMVGDTLLIALSKRHMAIMHSYPNQVLLPREIFAAALERMKGLRFDTMYGAFAWQTLQGNAMEVFKESMNRYVKAYGL